MKNKKQLDTESLKTSKSSKFIPKDMKNIARAGLGLVAGLLLAFGMATTKSSTKSSTLIVGGVIIIVALIIFYYAYKGR